MYYNIHTVFKLRSVIYSNVLKEVSICTEENTYLIQEGVQKLCFVGIECLIEC